MSRLTKLVNKNSYLDKYCWNSGADEVDITNKLGQLEDIEEKYEIDGFDDLDERLRSYKFLANHEYSTLERRDLNQMIDICQNVYAVEEELGIDLITLFKALTNGVYRKTENDIIYYTPTSLQIMKRKEWYLYHLSYTHLKLKDYGKTWALTKEELL